MKERISVLQEDVIGTPLKTHLLYGDFWLVCLNAHSMRKLTALQQLVLMTTTYMPYLVELMGIGRTGGLRPLDFEI